jgi:hypothetical protein
VSTTCVQYLLAVEVSKSHAGRRREEIQV